MREDDCIGKVFGSWYVVSRSKDGYNRFYQCKCRDCDFTHTVSKENLISKITCPTCPEPLKSPVDDIVGILGGMLGLTETKKTEINKAFEKLNQPEFKDIYTSLERASGSIKNVMNGKSGAPDIARKVLEAEAASLKSAFDNLVKDGKVTEEEVRILKTDINSSANFQKLKTILESMKLQQTSETKKTKI